MVYTAAPIIIIRIKQIKYVSPDIHKLQFCHQSVMGVQAEKTMQQMLEK